ncbi:HNH endonuclease [bacterium]|nr:HNH endonuclease [bacterium]
MGRAWEFPEYPENWGEISAEVKRRANYTCQDCGVRPPYLHAHHIRSLSKGGTNDLSNLKAVCEDCHSKYHPHMRPLPDRPAPKPKRHTGKTRVRHPPRGMTLSPASGATNPNRAPAVGGSRIGYFLALGLAFLAGAAGVGWLLALCDDLQSGIF